MHGSSTCFTYPWNFPHFIINSVLVFCNGLTPFNGYALRTFFTRKKGIDTFHVVFSWKAAPPIIVVSEQQLSAPSMAYFTPKGAPHSPAHIQTLIIMVDLGESKLSHTFIATSCPFQLCCRKQHVKISKWSWHFGDDHHEVNETRTMTKSQMTLMQMTEIYAKRQLFRLWNIPLKGFLFALLRNFWKKG